MDMGDLTSRQIGNMMADGMLRVEEQLSAGDFSNLANMGRAASQNELAALARNAFNNQAGVDSGVIPSTIRNQNLGHNSKKTGLGPNTRRK